MPIKTVVIMGNERLGQPSLSVKEFDTPELNALIVDLADTMQARKGLGIAAPQIGNYQRVILFGFEHNDRYPNESPVPMTLLINPTYDILSHEMLDGWEGCLSVPGLRGLVPRYKKIQYAGFDAKGSRISGIAEGFHARVIQHECDHIDGVLFPERIKNLKQFGFEQEVTDRMYK